MKSLPPLVELRAFDAAARHMSFKKAALELGVTPTAISHQIKLLERYCGCALFRRRPRPMTLTDDGVRLFPAIRSGLESFEGAIVSVRRLAEELPLRITATNAFASRWLVPRLPQWRKLHASVPLEVIGTDSVLNLDAGDSDVAIRYATSRSGDPAGVAEVLLTDNFWPVYNPKLLVPARLKQPADLARHLLIHAYWAPGDRDPPTWRRWLNAARRNWADAPEDKDMQHLSFREESHAIEAVIGGQGVGLFSDVLVAKELAEGTLAKAFDLSLPGYRFYVVRRPDHPREKQIQAFVSWLKSAT